MYDTSHLRRSRPNLTDTFCPQSVVSPSLYCEKFSKSRIDSKGLNSGRGLPFGSATVALVVGGRVATVDAAMGAIGSAAASGRGAGASFISRAGGGGGGLLGSMAAAGGRAVFISSISTGAAAGDDWAIDRDIGLVTHQRITPLSTVAAVLSSTRPMVAALLAFFTSTGTSPTLVKGTLILADRHLWKRSAMIQRKLVFLCRVHPRLSVVPSPDFRPQAAMELGFIHIVAAAPSDYCWPRAVAQPVSKPASALSAHAHRPV